VRPVIVDFGLAGRKLRAGCATGNYGAPEIWSATTAEALRLSPLAADVYAFACLTYEMFTGEVLFDGPNDMAIIARHLAHDGLPPGLRELQKRREAEGFVELLFGALRRDPSARSSVADLQRDFGRLARGWRGQEWPLL
jgi:serine/threonine protein kinase